jgi:hypothetical protein
VREWLRFRVEHAYHDGVIPERDIMLAWLARSGWMEIT